MSCITYSISQYILYMHIREPWAVSVIQKATNQCTWNSQYSMTWKKQVVPVRLLDGVIGTQDICFRSSATVWCHRSKIQIKSEIGRICPVPDLGCIPNDSVNFKVNIPIPFKYLSLLVFHGFSQSKSLRRMRWPHKLPVRSWWHAAIIPAGLQVTA